MDHSGKLALFERIAVPHLNAAYNLSRWLTGNAGDAEDLVQESYLKAFRAFETFQGSDLETARSWLLAIVRNTCFTWLKKNGGQSFMEFDEELHRANPPAPDAESLLLHRATLAALNACIEKLPLEFRETIVLREIEELSYKEISEIVRVPLGTVMSRLARARKRLHDCLAGANA